MEAYDPVGHEPGGQEGQDEDESHHEEHQRRSDVGQQVLLLQGRVALQHGASLLVRHLRHLEAVLQRRLRRHDAVRVRHGHVAEKPQVGLLPRPQPLGPPHEDGAVDGDVEEEDDDEADEEHGGVDLLVGLAEEGGEDDLVEAALARVDHRLLLRQQALGDASRRQGVHHGDGGVAGVLLTVRAGDRPRDTFKKKKKKRRRVRETHLKNNNNVGVSERHVLKKQQRRRVRETHLKAKQKTQACPRDTFKNK